MKTPMLMLSAITLLGGSGLAQAGPMSEAVVRVRARIVPYIAVSEPQIVVVHLQDHSAGFPIAGRVQFSVWSNAPDVELQVSCTDLCKGGDPASAYRIPVAGPGAAIMCDDGSDRLLAWSSAGAAGLLPPGWTGAVSEIGDFSTSSAGAFHGNVAVEVSWHSDDFELPVGEYSGIVRLIGMVRP